VKNFFTAFNLEEAYNNFENSGYTDISSACMPSLSLTDLLDFYNPDLQEKFCFELLNKPLGYSVQYGDLEFRNKLATGFYQNLKAENLLLTSGASEAIYLIMSSLFERGDSIIVQKPIYQSLYQIAFDRGVRIIDWDCDLEQYQWDISKLEDLITKNPEAKALIINNPNNPTGLAFNTSELKEISKLLGDRLLISDEVFLFISKNEIQSVSNIHPYSLAISDLSKSFSMPGLRLGWICASQSMTASLENFSGLKNYLSLRSSTLSEFIGSWVLDKSKKIIKNNKNILSQNIDLFFKSPFYSELFINNFSGQDIDGLNCFLRFKDDINIKNFLTVCKQNKIFLASGELFGDKYPRYCRIGLGQMDTQILNQLTQSFLAAHP
jgi:aspartate/methionine/tyrosine aminotransferase